MWGMIPRTARTIFETLSDARFDFNLKISYLEIYNEELRDLLNTSTEKPKLRLQEDVNHTVVCKGLEEFSVNTVDNCMELLRRGSRERQTAATFSNHNSSRSHSIFTFKLLVRETVAVGEEVIKTGQLNLVDLAGSECIGISGSRGDMAVEAGNINKSLLTLGRVISALVDVQPHIPYRDSKLTRLLQDSLGGRAKTSIIATVSPSVVSLEESLSTLDYAARARCVKNQPTINSTSQAKHVMKDLHYELESMRSQLQMSRDKNGVFLDPREYEELMNKLSAQTMALQEAESTIAVREQEVKQLQEKQQDYLDQIKTLSDAKDQLEKQVQQLTETNLALEQRLGTMFVHVQTQRQIVVEQVRTEETLRAKATQLQDTIHERDREIASLLSRVQRLEQQEAQRQLDGKDLARKLADGHVHMRSAVTTLKEHAETQQQRVAATLSQLQERQTHWQTTVTSSLQALLQEQLQRLVLDQDIRTLETHSRDILWQHVQTNAATLQAQVNSLGQQWSQWLQTGHSQVSEVQSILSTQHGLLSDTHRCIETQSNELQRLIGTWQDAQQTRRQDTRQLLDRYEAHVGTHLFAAKTELLAQTQTAQQQFAVQIAGFQEQMAAMFATMTQEYDGLCSRVVGTVDSQHDTSRQIAQEHVQMCRELVTEAHHAQIADSLETLGHWRQTFQSQVLDGSHLLGVSQQHEALASTVVPSIAANFAAQTETALPTQVASLQSAVHTWQDGTETDIQTLEAHLRTTSEHVSSLHSALLAQSESQHAALSDLWTGHRTEVRTQAAQANEETLAVAQSESTLVDDSELHVQDFESSLSKDFAPHRGDTPVNLPVSDTISFPVTRSMEEIVQGVVAGFVEAEANATPTTNGNAEKEKEKEKEQQAPQHWRAALQRDSVAPRSLDALSALAVSLTKHAIEHSNRSNA
jgi:kinesin family protein 11